MPSAPNMIASNTQAQSIPSGPVILAQQSTSTDLRPILNNVSPTPTIVTTETMGTNIRTMASSPLNLTVTKPSSFLSMTNSTASQVSKWFGK